ncbi:MAG: LCCL domain-containing protein [Gammaproteobacteria bacterium]
MNHAAFRVVNRSRHLTVLVFVITAAMALAACSRQADGPSRDDVETALKMELGGFVEVRRIEIVASQDTGSEVSPARRLRFKAQVALKEPTYEVASTLQSTTGTTRVLNLAHKAGTKVEMHGIADARKKGERWDVHRVHIESEAPLVGGAFLASFGANVVISGSQEERELEARIAEERRAREQAAREAERLAAEQAAARQAKIAAFGEALAGTWSAKDPAIHNGSIWSNRDGATLGIELVLAAPSGTHGEGNGVVYDFRSPFREMILPVSYVIDDSGEFATVSFMQGGGHPTLGFRIDTRSKWRLTSSGELRNAVRGNDWLIRLEKDGPVAAQRKAVVDRFQSLQSRYSPASGQFRSLGLDAGESGRFLVVGDSKGIITGAGPYDMTSVINAAVVHQGLLKHGEAGIVEVTLRGRFEIFQFPSVTRNGIKSREGSNAHGQYSMTLIEAGQE